jgi:hypothetical protein
MRRTRAFTLLPALALAGPALGVHVGSPGAASFPVPAHSHRVAAGAPGAPAAAGRAGSDLPRENIAPPARLPRAGLTGRGALEQPVGEGSGLALSRAEMETFLRQARVVRIRSVSKGITGTVRATLTDGALTHDASIQTIDESRKEFQTDRGVELNFRDTWRFNVAAYLLDKLLDLQMTPATVERSYGGRDASFTWWVDDVLMDEGERLRQRVRPPDLRSWADQMWVVRVFDQLVYNTDRNVGNLLIDRAWRLWMIDHTRAFRWHRALRSPENLVRCDRDLLERLRRLDEATLERELGRYLGPMEIKGILARRDLIVAHFDRAGPATLYDRVTRR